MKWVKIEDVTGSTLRLARIVHEGFCWGTRGILGAMGPGPGAAVAALTQSIEPVEEETP